MQQGKAIDLDADYHTQRATSKPAKMVRISVLNDALRNMVNAERKGKRQVRTQTPHHATPHPPSRKKKKTKKKKHTKRP